MALLWKHFKESKAGNNENNLQIPTISKTKAVKKRNRLFFRKKIELVSKNADLFQKSNANMVPEESFNLFENFERVNKSFEFYKKPTQTNVNDELNQNKLANETEGVSKLVNHCGTQTAIVVSDKDTQTETESVCTISPFNSEIFHIVKNISHPLIHVNSSNLNSVSLLNKKSSNAPLIDLSISNEDINHCPRNIIENPIDESSFNKPDNNSSLKNLLANDLHRSLNKLENNTASTPVLVSELKQFNSFKSTSVIISSSDKELHTWKSDQFPTISVKNIAKLSRQNEQINHLQSKDFLKKNASMSKEKEQDSKENLKISNHSLKSNKYFDSNIKNSKVNLEDNLPEKSKFLKNIKQDILENKENLENTYSKTNSLTEVNCKSCETISNSSLIQEGSQKNKTTDCSTSISEEKTQFGETSLMSTSNESNVTFLLESEVSNPLLFIPTYNNFAQQTLCKDLNCLPDKWFSSYRTNQASMSKLTNRNSTLFKNYQFSKHPISQYQESFFHNRNKNNSSVPHNLIVPLKNLCNKLIILLENQSISLRPAIQENNMTLINK